METVTSISQSLTQGFQFSFRMLVSREPSSLQYAWESRAPPSASATSTGMVEPTSSLLIRTWGT